ncbi:PulJ/GspJ family protein [Cloacibacillus evryensis]|uniref:PulJ/GspJ family protein n=1 Tax=Cloacibacillus evryensis TaxID=508460 RepID=UPI0004B50214|nr:prepilin-type N-terminal cleavage/methylation domain-containing protein [Cloacibacillus evryensis]MEA5034288.1 prepilin-type N-terminal cleavage/methylation domain-containing protein [Cloacibacillus evryensis]
MSRRRSGFTLIEVMIAVMVLALSTTAAIRLVIMAQNTLSAVKDKEGLINAAQAVEAGISTEELSDVGTSGDFKWETKDKETEMFGEGFGRLDFDKAASGDGAEPVRVKWREITVADKKDKKITLYIPSKEDSEENVAEGLSADKSEKSENTGQSGKK